MRIPVLGKKYSAHRLAWFLHYGEWPSKQLDHIDGDKLNNAISNLRLVTPSLNQLFNNKPRKGSKTGYVGVVLSRGKYKAQIKVNGTQIYLGEFDSPEIANAAYMKARAEAIASAQGIGKDQA